MKDIAQELVVSLFNYNPLSGILSWKVDRRRVKAGDICGSPDTKGYLRVGINGRRYRVHTIIILFVYGFISEQVDHFDMIEDNNRLSNLRPCTKNQNQHNKKTNRNNTSGFKNVYWNKSCNKWQVQVGLNGKDYNFGVFANIENAVKASISARIQLHGDFANHG